MRSLYLKKNEDKRIRNGHLWVFSNEVDTHASPLQDFSAGETATLYDNKHTVLGSVYVNPSTLICARLYSRQGEVQLDENLLFERLSSALSLREKFFVKPWYRLCNSEGDYLPGLIIDRYDTHLTVQITTAGMEEHKDLLLHCLERLLAPKSIFFDNNLPLREMEYLDLKPDSKGVVPEHLEVPENNCRFKVSVTNGQKTGWFYDQRDNRRVFARLAKDCTVLDAFAYTGGFGVTAAVAGAKAVTFLDASPPALQLAFENLVNNAPWLNAEGRASYICGNAFQKLAELYTEGQRFALISLDPPALIKRRKDFAQGLAAYRKLNLLAVRLLSPGGILVSSSCSFHLPAEALYECVARAAQKIGCNVRVLYLGRQGADHPSLLAMPETAYLKCCVVQII